MPTDGSPSPATGLLIQVKGKQYFVTALHNFFHDYGNMEQVVKSWEENEVRCFVILDSGVPKA